jgi:hypothetical protein
LGSDRPLRHRRSTRGRSRSWDQRSLEETSGWRIGGELFRHVGRSADNVALHDRSCDA